MHPKNGCSQLLRNRGKFVSDYTASRGRNTFLKNQNWRIEGRRHVFLTHQAVRKSIIIIVIITTTRKRR